MSAGPARRVALVAGWLLTPVVAWAASLLGAWLGALAGAGGGTRGVVLLGAGAFIGAAGGVLAWALLLRQLSRARPASPDPDVDNG